MANDFPGPLSPDQLAAIQSYYGVPGVNMSAAPVGAPAPPPVSDAGAYYNYNPAPEAAPFGPPPAPPPAARPVGAQLSQVGSPQSAPFSGTGPTGPEPPKVPYFGPELNAADMLAGSPGFEGKSAAQLTPGAKPSPKSGQAIPTGPSAQDDAEFAAFRRLQDTKPAAKGGTGGGGKANPDPFGIKGAQKNVLGSFDAERSGMEHASTAEGDRSVMIAAARGDLAATQQQDAAIRAGEVDEAQRGFDAHMAEVQRQMEEVRAQKIDPSRLMKQDGMAFRAVVGGLLGGLYMGLNKLDHNPFIDDLNKQIDRDVAAQERDLSTKQQGVADSMNMLREQRSTFKDNDLAKLQTRNAMYEASKVAIEAEAAKFDQPMVKARAEQAIAGVDRQQAELQRQIGERAQSAAGAAAAAGAAQQRALGLEMRKSYGDTYEKALAAGLSPAVAEAEATRMVQTQFQGGAAPRPAEAAGAHSDPVSMVPKDQRESAIKEREGHAKAEGAIANITKMYKGYDATGITSPRQLEAYRASIATAVKANAGPGMSSDDDYKRFIEPNLPTATDTADTLRVKEAMITNALRSSVATPTLDQHAPGWKGPPPVKEFSMSGKPLP